MRTKLSLIIPIYNAESFIAESILKIIDWKSISQHNIEVLLINDGSEDKTKSILQGIDLKSNAIKLISYSKNKGKGYAVKTGMNSATGEYLFFTDADVPYGFEIIDKMLEYLASKNFDLCIGNRMDNSSSYHVRMGFVRKISSKLFTFFISNFTIKNIGDTQCGIKGFTKEAAHKIFSKTKINGFAFDVESVYLSHKYGFSIKRLPVKFQGNNSTTINLLSSSIRMCFDVLSLPIRYHILKVY